MGSHAQVKEEGVRPQNNQLKPPKRKKPVYKRVWFWVVAVMVFFMIVGNLAGNDDGNGNPASNADNEVAATATLTPDPVVETAAPDAPENYEEDMSALEPDKKLMIISDVFDVIGKTETEVIDWVGEPEETHESKFRLSGTDTTVPAKTLIYSKFGDYEYFLVDGQVQRLTHTTNPNNVWRFEEKSLYDFMYTYGLKDAKLVEKNEKVAIYKHDKLYDIRVFNDGGNISYLYIIADEKYK